MTIRLAFSLYCSQIGFSGAFRACQSHPQCFTSLPRALPNAVPFDFEDLSLVWLVLSPSGFDLNVYSDFQWPPYPGNAPVSLTPCPVSMFLITFITLVTTPKLFASVFYLFVFSFPLLGNSFTGSGDAAFIHPVYNRIFDAYQALK